PVAEGVQREISGPGDGRYGQRLAQGLNSEQRAAAWPIAVDGTLWTALRGREMNLGTPGHAFEAKSDLLVASLEQAGAAVKRCTGLSETPETIERLPERVERVSPLARLADEVLNLLGAVQ